MTDKLNDVGYYDIWMKQIAEDIFNIISHPDEDECLHSPAVDIYLKLDPEDRIYVMKLVFNYINETNKTNCYAGLLQMFHGLEYNDVYLYNFVIRDSILSDNPDLISRAIICLDVWDNEGPYGCLKLVSPEFPLLKALANHTYESIIGIPEDLRLAIRNAGIAHLNAVLDNLSNLEFLPDVMKLQTMISTTYEGKLIKVETNYDCVNFYVLNDSTLIKYIYNSKSDDVTKGTVQLSQIAFDN